MKQLYKIFFFIFIVGSALAQPSSITSLIDQYSGKDGFIILNLNDASIVLREIVKNKSAQEAIKSVRKITLIRFSTEELKEDKKTEAMKNGKNFYSHVKNFRAPDYDELMSLSQGSNLLRSYFKKNDKGDNEFIMTITAEDHNSLIMYLNGSFTKEEILEIAKSIKF